MSSAKDRSFRSPAWYPGRRSARGIHISRSRGRLRQRTESISFTVSDARVDSSRRMVAAAGSMAPPTAGMTARTAPPDGAALYAARCSSCHDHAVDWIQPKVYISTRRGAIKIIEALTCGMMRAQAGGLVEPLYLE